LTGWNQPSILIQQQKCDMPQAIQLEVRMPGDLAKFRLPKAVEKRLHALLDKQDHGQPLTPAEKGEAEGLVELAETLSLLRLRSQRVSRGNS
jgi:hypothetical protein